MARKKIPNINPDSYRKPRLTPAAVERRKRLVAELQKAYADGEMDGGPEADVNEMQRQIKVVRDRVAADDEQGQALDSQQIMKVQRENHRLSCPKCDYVFFRMMPEATCKLCGHQGTMNVLWCNPNISIIDDKPTFIDPMKQYPM